MDWFWTALSSLITVAVLLQVQTWLMKKKKILPPGPRGLPLIGHLHMLGKNIHRDLHRLSQKHGPIMYMRFGSVPNIIVSSPQAAEQFLKTHDLVFADRPVHEVFGYLFYDHSNLTLAQYGPYWRNMRKLCTLELLSNLKINSFQSMRREELSLFIDSLKAAAKDGATVDLSAGVSSLSADMSCRMVFGKKYSGREFSERGFKTVIEEGMQLLATPNLGDYFPYLKFLDIQGVIRRIKVVSKVCDGFLEKTMEEHVQADDKGRTKDFVDTMMTILESGETEFQFNRGNVKAVLLDMMVASMDTSATTTEWTLSELLKHPQVLKKLQEETERIVGMDRMVEESDLERLEYLDMVVKEAMRLHPVVPLLLPHEAREECVVNGFHIPKKSQVLINAWAIGQDPNAWSDPDKFIPERFLGSTIDFRAHNFQLIPFGSGRRGCPGMQLGLLLVRLMVAQLVHCFDWKLPNDLLSDDLDMTEEFGLVMTRARHLMAIPTYRLQK